MPRWRSHCNHWLLWVSPLYTPEISEFLRRWKCIKCVAWHLNYPSTSLNTRNHQRVSQILKVHTATSAYTDPFLNILNEILGSNIMKHTESQDSDKQHLDSYRYKRIPLQSTTPVIFFIRNASWNTSKCLELARRENALVQQPRKVRKGTLTFLILSQGHKLLGDSNWQILHYLSRKT